MRPTHDLNTLMTILIALFVNELIEYERKLMEREKRLHSREESLRNDKLRQKEVSDRIAGLTPRQRQIMELVLAGHRNKNIAVDLGISLRTVENHRAAMMRKTGLKSLPALARLVAL